MQKYEELYELFETLMQALNSKNGEVDAIDNLSVALHELRREITDRDTTLSDLMMELQETT